MTGNAKDDLREAIALKLGSQVKCWLVTGAAGFIGSHLVRSLLLNGQQVVGLDNLRTGKISNLDSIASEVGSARWSNFSFHQGDIRDEGECRTACSGVDFVLHHAALGSVPWSVEDPVTTHDVNVTGFLNVLVAARESGVRRVVYASSSAVYGDSISLPQQEDSIGRQLSPYAASKLANEIYAQTWQTTFDTEAVGLRYFNVFGPRQDPTGPYAAVIPLWLSAMVAGKEIIINGDGDTTRDFCHVNNVVYANILAATSEFYEMRRIFNVAGGQSISLLQLFSTLKDALARLGVDYAEPPHFGPFRPGDVRHSTADICRAKSDLGYRPITAFNTGLREYAAWQIRRSTPPD